MSDILRLWTLILSPFQIDRWGIAHEMSLKWTLKIVSSILTIVNLVITVTNGEPTVTNWENALLGCFSMSVKRDLFPQKIIVDTTTTRMLLWLYKLHNIHKRSG